MLAFTFNIPIAAQKVPKGKQTLPEQPPIDTSMSVNEALSTIKSLVTQSTVTNEYRVSRTDVIEEFGSGRWHYEYVSSAMRYVQPRRLGSVYEVGFARTSIRDFDTAQRLAAAINRMIWENSPERLAKLQAEFAETATAWRTAAVRPAMPEDARQHKVLAEDAVQRKNFDKAIDEYDAALRIFPTWPEGQFNMALLCGETGDYDCAVERMQNYLDLVPDAPDAQAAKDKIIVWRDRIKTGNN